MADTIKFSQLGEITRAQMAGSDYAVGYKANGDNKKWTFENQADFLLNDSEAGQEFQETFVKVQNTEPTDENNKIWIEETPEREVEVPTYDEFKDLSNLVSGVNEAVFNKLSATVDQLSVYIPFTFSTFAGKRYIIKNESSAGGMLARIRQTRDGENGTYVTNGTQAGQTSVYEAAEDADYIAVMFGPTSTNPAFSIIQEDDVPSKVEEISEDVENLKSAIDELDDYVMPNTILDFEDNISVLTGLTISCVSKTKLVATSTGTAVADYIPITVTANKEYLFYFDFSTTDGGNVNIRFYESDKSTLIKAYSTNKEEYHYTPTASKTIYLRLYFLNANSTLTVKDSFVGLYSEYGNLIGKIGNPQLTADMQSLISNLTKKTNDHESELNVLNDYVLPTNLIDFESNESALSGLAIQKISKTTLKASRPSNDASAAYWIPISVQSGAYKFKFTFTSADGGNLNIRLFDTNKSTELKAFSTSNKVEEFTFAESKTVYIRLYFLSLNKVLDITDSIIAPSAVFNEYLSQKIGYKQLADDLSQYWVKIEDKFDITEKYSATGVTDSKDGNEISLTTTDDSSYIIYNLTCDENKKYALYYDLTGTYTGGNYSFQVRLFSTTFTSFIETISQTSGAGASGTILINPGTGDGGKFSINMPNANGQSISGDMYIYDVTNLSQEQIDSIDWENVGASALVFTGNSGGSSNNSWSGKKVVFYGDSITQTSYPEKVQAKLGFTLVKNAYGGSRFGYASSANAFSDDTRISELPTDADVVCIMGGTNDWQHTEIETTALAYNDGFDRTKLKGAIAYTVQKIQARCTSARIYLLTNIGGRGNSDPTVIQPLPQVAPSGVGAGNTPLMVRNAMIEVAEELNIPVIDTWSCGINGFNRGTYIADTVHPTNAGQIVIAEYIANALMNDAPW